MVTVYAFGITCIMVLMVLGFLNTIGSFNNQQMQSNFAKLGCNYPLYHGNDFLNGTVLFDIHNFNYGTQYICTVHCTVPSNNCQIQITANYVNYNSTTTLYSGGPSTGFPVGWFQYIGDTLGSFALKALAIVNIGFTFLTPINFTFLGFNVTQVSLAGTIFIYGVYIVVYLGVGVMAYKIIDPFAQ